VKTAVPLFLLVEPEPCRLVQAARFAVGLNRVDRDFLARLNLRGLTGSRRSIAHLSLCCALKKLHQRGAVLFRTDTLLGHLGTRSVS
jgi:hypothetical protein